jgi:DNA-binding NarL/FixJ family response regulator
VSELVIEQRGGRFLVFLREGGRLSRLGGFASRDDAERYVVAIAAASDSVVDANVERALAAALYEATVAGENVRKWIEERNRAIVAALAAGASQRAVAEATGLSHPAVAKIAKRLA